MSEYKSATGAVREQLNKPEMSQLDPRFIMEMAELLTQMDKAGKYDKYNWTKGMEFTRTLDSLDRHLHDVKIGRDYDVESKKKSIIHVAVNAMFLYNSMMLDNPNFDDRHFKENK